MSNKQKLLNSAIYLVSITAGTATCSTVMDAINAYTDDNCKTGDRMQDRLHLVASVAVGFAAGCAISVATFDNLNDIVKGYKVVKEVLNG